MLDLVHATHHQHADDLGVVGKTGDVQCSGAVGKAHEGVACAGVVGVTAANPRLCETSGYERVWVAKR